MMTAIGAVEGNLQLLEFAMPTRRLVGSLYRFYFRYVLPLIGRAISASGSAYTYLPQSVPNFPQREEFLEHMRAVGFEDTSSTDLSGGTVCLYRGRSS